MAVKRCPCCQQTLPVACKSCPCGHVFITKKCHISKDSEDEKNEQLPLKRLRPEKPKREIPDYDYDDFTHLTQASLNGGELQPNTFSKRIFAENYDHDNFDHDNFSLVRQTTFERSDSFEDGMRPAKKKRGRPKGSKNKPKNALLAGICGENYHNPDRPSQLYSNSPRKPGRPKGSKNKVNSDMDGEPVLIKVRTKPNKLPPVPQEKIVSYSLILSDINEKLMSQNKIKSLLGI